MPGRRSDKKGSFGGHFDELVKVFEPEPARKIGRPEERKPKEGENVHDRLFASTWRAVREKGR